MEGLRLWGVTSKSTVFEDKLGQILFISFLNSASQRRWARTPGKTVRKQVAIMLKESKLIIPADLNIPSEISFVELLMDVILFFNHILHQVKGWIKVKVKAESIIQLSGNVFKDGGVLN